MRRILRRRKLRRSILRKIFSDAGLRIENFIG
jgi:hypothetical protein